MFSNACVAYPGQKGRKFGFVSVLEKVCDNSSTSSKMATFETAAVGVEVKS